MELSGKEIAEERCYCAWYEILPSFLSSHSQSGKPRVTVHSRKGMNLSSMIISSRQAKKSVYFRHILTRCSNSIILFGHEIQPWRLRWRLSGGESACQCRRHGFDPWSRKFPHAAQQLSLCATTIEPVFKSLGAAATEAHVPYNLFSSVRSLSRVRFFVTPRITAPQASLSITNSQSLLKLMSIESVMHPAISSSVVPFSSCPQSLPASGSFPMSQLFA